MSAEPSSGSLFSVLLLPEPTTSSPPIPKTEVHKAYRRALLLHHPDKSPPQVTTTEASSQRQVAPLAQIPSKPTIDQIKFAYLMLSSPTSQRDYVQKLFQSHTIGDQKNDVAHVSTGLEVIDLDDMLFDEDGGYYFRPCRCGRDKSYRVSETELEEHAEDGEVRIGCEGCSLQVVIEFGVIE